MMMLNQPANPADDIARVSISARLVPLFSFMIAALGGGFGGLELLGTIQALRHAENAGIGAVSGALIDSNIPVIAGLSLALLVGLIGVIISIVRLFMPVKKASPPFWFFILPGLLGLLPSVLFFASQTIILNAILPQTASTGANVATVASSTAALYTLAMTGSVIAIPLLLGAALVPISSSKTRKFGSLTLLLVFQAAMIAGIVILVNRSATLNKINYELGMIVSSLF